MEYRQLGLSDLRVSTVALGCFPFGSAGWGPVDDRESMRTIHRALDLGINFFDVADVYGDGHAEEVLGRALRGRRADAIIGTKVGYTAAGGIDASRDHIMDALEGSLKRLETNYVDVYQIHRPDPATPIEESLSAMQDLWSLGKIRYIGVSNFSASQISECLSVARIEAVQSHYSMLERGIESEIIPLCKREQIGLAVYRVIERGLLTGKFGPTSSFPSDDIRSQNPMFIGESFQRKLQLVYRLAPIAALYGKTVGQLAISWVLSHEGVTTAIVGAKTPKQLEENAIGAGWTPSKDDLDLIGRLLSDDHDIGT